METTLAGLGLLGLELGTHSFRPGTVLMVAAMDFLPLIYKDWTDGTFLLTHHILTAHCPGGLALCLTVVSFQVLWSMETSYQRAAPGYNWASDSE